MNIVGRLGLACVALIVSVSSGADEYARQWAPAVGTKMPVLEAQDHAGKPRTLENLRGENGLLIFFNRSADW